MRRPTKIVLSVLLGSVVICCGGGLIGGKLLADKTKKASISPATFQAIRLGQPEDQVRKLVDGDSTFAHKEQFGDEPPVPAGAHCTYALSSKDTGGPFHSVYRFCFTAGALVEKNEIQPPDTK